MSATLSSHIVSAWWHGLSLWYNVGDYQGAMNVWFQDVVLVVMDDKPAEHDGYHCRLLQNIQNRAKSLVRDENRGKLRQRVAIVPLLLFLAGCYLDADEHSNARWLLVTAEALLESKQQQMISETEQEMIEHVVRELISYLQEDPTVTRENAQSQSREFLDHVISIWNSREEKDVESHTFPAVPWVNAYQNPGFFYRPLKKQPKGLLERSEHPKWCRDLEKHWLDIRKEFLELQQKQQRSQSIFYSVGSGSHRQGAGHHDGTAVLMGQWTECVLAGSGAVPSVAPRTCEVLRRYCPNSVLSLAEEGGGEVIFSVLAPHTTIAPHWGTTNFRLTAHLPLVVPLCDGNAPVDGTCALKVADEWVSWKEGEMIVFDDSFEHAVVNKTDSTRVVLLMRFWHPDLPIHARQDAVEQAMRFKADDALRRCNPTSPPCNDAQLYEPVWLRGMERTECSSCGGCGFQTIRVDEVINCFRCACGADIR